MAAIGIVFVFVGVFLLVQGDIPADRVTSLPGWNGPLPSTHYSGYLPVNGGQLHYWLILSENDPSSDPVLMWLNGGPGSSSLIGLLTENGQIHTSDDSLVNATHGPNLIYNPYSWTKNYSVVYLEQPRGVGFSYCDAYPCVNDDYSQAEDVYTFLVEFFKGFSELASLDFYITGESYAGIYIPLIMDQIDQKGGINLKGAAIGDGCWGNSVGTCSSSPDATRFSVEFYQGHGMFAQTLSDQMATVCGNFSTLSAACLALVAQMEGQIGNFDIYNVYDTCGNDQALPPAELIRKAHTTTSFSLSKTEDAFQMHPQLGGALNDYACGAETVMGTYLAQQDVMDALHVKANDKGMSYRRTATDLRPLYKTLIAKYRMLIYSGDVDACVPFTGSEEWTRLLGYEVKTNWRPWQAPSTGALVNNIKAGYVIEYGGTGVNEFYYATINGAGHMVPQFKPIPAYVMITRFISGQPL